MFGCVCKIYPYLHLILVLISESLICSKGLCLRKVFVNHYDGIIDRGLVFGVGGRRRDNHALLQV